MDKQYDLTKFDGIFYSLETGLDLIVHHQDEFLEMVKENPLGLFYVAGGYVDLMVNGLQEVAENLLAKAKLVWPNEHWTAHQIFLTVVVDHAQKGNPNVFSAVNEHFTPKENRVPDGFIAYCLPNAIFDLLFARPEEVIIPLTQAGCGDLAVQLLICLKANHLDDMYNEYRDMLEKRWPDYPWHQLIATVSELPTLMEKENWQELIKDWSIRLFPPRFLVII